MLTLTDVHTYYGDSHVLQGVTLSVEKGTVTAVLGRNGVGKTTLCRSIVGLTPARAGSVVFNGEEITALPPHRIYDRGICLVPQGRRIFSSLSVLENLVVARQAPRKASPQWTLERVLALFPRLADRGKQLAGSLSGGEQQMLAIGRALMGNPRVLLMDEPSEGLAPMLVAEVGRTIKELKKEGQSILLVEQNIKLALDIADDVVILNTGRVAHAGTVAAVRADDALLTQHLGVH